MTDATFDQIALAIAPAQSILVASHIRPDGDALGSTIAFGLWLHSLGKKVSALNEDGVPQKFRYLPCHEMIGVPAGAADYDVFVALDTSVKNRLGTVLGAVKSAGVTINMDHHTSNERFSDLNYVDSSSPATGQIVYEFLASQSATITKEIAGNLFAAISTDTGSFQYPNTTARTFEVAADLVRAGVEVGELSKSMYERQPRRRLELLRHALNEARYTCDGHVASFRLTIQDADRLGVLPEDNEGIIDHLRSVDEVVAAVFFEELPDAKIRVSARSKNSAVDVCKVCRLFGGGGHTLAAGARIAGSVEEVEKRFLEALCHEVRNSH